MNAQQLRQMKLEARHAFSYAVVKGEIERQPCSRCGSKENIQGHHPDYSQPFKVVWLCKPCHLDHHRIYTNRPGCKPEPIATSDKAA